MNTRPLILITNDDGINAPGIRTLINIVKLLGDVIVVAPEQSYSGMGHAVTLTTPIRLRKITESKEYSEYASSGTPVDCVKLALNNILQKEPDLVVSGINHGANSSVNIIYSGTMAAAIEGSLGGITSIGFSLVDFSYNADFDSGIEFIRKIIIDVLSSNYEKGSCLNVNIPAVKHSEIKGIKVCRQSKGNWVEAFDDREDPQNRKYYWLSGSFKNQENCTETDLWALENNYISIVPITLDYTRHEQIAAIKNLEYNV
jgi:5'-nucleotidase